MIALPLKQGERGVLHILGKTSPTFHIYCSKVSASVLGFQMLTCVPTLFVLPHINELSIKKTYSDLSSPNSLLPLHSKGNLASIRLSVEIFISISFRESKNMHKMPDPHVSTELLRNKPVVKPIQKKGSQKTTQILLTLSFSLQFCN